MSIVINLTKAKAIGHDIRRAKRAEEFAPHDDIIAKQIPGADAAEAEAARAEIRDRYAVMQIDIDAAATPAEIKDALGLPENESVVRARNELGQFVGDDPATPENEAWVVTE